jgi:hypothetical protein
MREAAAVLAAGQILPFKPEQKPVRFVICGATVAAVVLLVAALTLHPPQPADVSPWMQASATSNVYAIEATVDVKVLPRHDMFSKVDERLIRAARNAFAFDLARAAHPVGEGVGV